MSKPYAIISDLHFHNWSTFATTDSNGVNSRLWLLIDEVERVARDLHSRGGRTIIIAGDVFHVRGKIAPSVLNPVIELFERLIKGLGMEVYIIAGNHDLEGKESNRLGSAITALEGVGCVCVSDEGQAVALDGVGDKAAALVPWHEELGALKKLIEGMPHKEDVDLVIHAPMNYVIKGIPDTGLDPTWLQGLGFRNVFSGHYHNHKAFGNVYSIGAIAHHSWSDVGTTAGYLIVDGDTGDVNFRATSCPQFVELTPDMSVEEMALEADGNYVKARVNTSDATEIAGLRKLLEDHGAKGVVIVPEPQKAAVTREESKVTKGMTLNESVSSYIDPTGSDPDRADLLALCHDILSKAQAVTE